MVADHQNCVFLGCNNGGGQLKITQEIDTGNESAQEQLVKTQTAYRDVPIVRPEEDDRVELLYQQLEMPQPQGDKVTAEERELFHTGYHVVESTLAPQLESW